MTSDFSTQIWGLSLRRAPILACMKRLTTFLITLALVAPGHSQTPLLGDKARPEIVLAKLPPPVYPPIARAARVAGDVEVSFQLRADGTVVSAEAVSGPPMLRQAAIDAVKQTQFQCKDCTGDLASFSITFRFALVEGPPCGAHDDSYPRLARSQNIITVMEQPVWLCDPAADRTACVPRNASTSGNADGDSRLKTCFAIHPLP